MNLLGSNLLAAITDNLANLVVGRAYSTTILGHYTLANKIPYLTSGTVCYGINCGRCHEACPFNLIPTALADAYERNDAQALFDLDVNQCMNCGSCSYVCPAHRPLGFMNTLGKTVVKEAGIK